MSRLASSFRRGTGKLVRAIVGLSALLLTGPTTQAMAQEPAPSLRSDGPLFSLPPPPIEELGAGGGDVATALVMLRLQHVRERRREGGALLTLGAVGVLGGALISVVGRDSPLYLAFGLTTLSFGAINVPLGIGLLDLRHRARDQALELTGASADAVQERVAEWARSERWKRVSFAVNAGLDVLYVLTGALLVGLAGRTNHPLSARGSGWAMITQGAALFVYDVYGIRATTRRLRTLSGDAWLESELLGL